MIKSIKELVNFVLDLFFNPPLRSTARARKVKVVLWMLAGIGAVAAVARLVNGLGASTNLSDITPWGLWIGFDVVSGVALAAGGFVIAAAVHIFHLHRFESIVRPAVLTAFLGYVAVAGGLIFDLGLWWNIWRPMIQWQHHSALFEVAWCVMLYLTVLSLEFAPVVLEKMPFPRVFKFFKKIMLPLVILGIMLSTLHQSSLGTLFLIMPYRLHPLWYSSIQPVLFFVSAIGLGLCMVIIESFVSGWIYHRPDETKMLKGLAKAGAVVLTIYLLIRLGDLAATGKLSYFNDPSWETMILGIELLLCAVIPILLFAIPSIRESRAGLIAGAGTGVIGFIFNRINVSGVSTISVTGTSYVPSWMEFAISAGVVSGAALVFLFFVEHFSVYEDHETGGEAEARPRESDGSYFSIWLRDMALYSLIFVLAAGIAVYMLPGGKVIGAQPEKTPVQIARNVTAIESQPEGQAFASLTLAGGTPKPDEKAVPVLLVDANRDGRFVLFDHESHQGLMGGKESCGQCHHLNRPLDQATVCTACHRDMYLTTDIFSHSLHQQKMGGNRGCVECHADTRAPKTRANATGCLSCHHQMVATGALVEFQPELLQRSASSYTDAMHGLCQKCHTQGDEMGRCATCHQETDPDYLRRLPSYPTRGK